MIDAITVPTITYRVTATDADFDPFEVAVTGADEQRADLLAVAVESRLPAGSGVFLNDDDGTGVLARPDCTTGQFTAVEVHE